MALQIQDKKFLHYINEMLLDFKNYPYQKDNETKKLMKDLKTILMLKKLTICFLENLVPYLIQQINEYEFLPYHLKNEEFRKEIYEEQNFILSYIKKYFYIREHNGFISIAQIDETSKIA